MTNIAEECANNEDYQQILQLFNDGYIPVYNKRRVALRNEIKLFMKRNFNNWYYSINCPIEPVSPARFINSDIYIKYGADIMVYPVGIPVYKKDKLMDINYTYRIFTLDDHPFIRDMDLFLKALEDESLEFQQDDELDNIFAFTRKNYSIFENYADFTFHERPYISNLGNVCISLSLISFSKSTRTGILRNDDAIKEFFALSGREKLERVVTVFAQCFTESFDFLSLVEKQPDVSDVLAVLKNDQSLDSFIEGLFGDQLTELIDNMDLLLAENDDMDDIDYIDDMDDMDDFIESLDEDSAKELVILKEFITTCGAHFFTIFGQYIQLIQPEYDTAFEFSASDDAFLELLKDAEDSVNENNQDFKDYVGSLIYHLPPGGYSLTTLGAGRLNKNFSKIKHERYAVISSDEYQDVLDNMTDEFTDDEYDDYFDNLYSYDHDEALKRFSKMLMDNLYEEPDPLEGLNPEGLPVINDKDATYRFRVSRKIIEVSGTDTLADLSNQIQWKFDLDELHLSSFYMGKKFFDAEREIGCPRFIPLGDPEPADAENYKIHELNLYENQKFLYLHDFAHENRFTVTFVGIR